MQSFNQQQLTFSETEASKKKNKINKVESFNR